jgi:hypothetical protein
MALAPRFQREAAVGSAAIDGQHGYVQIGLHVIPI